MWLQERLQHTILFLGMIEKWRGNLDKGGSCGALLTDLSKPFDCIVHELCLWHHSFRQRN